MAFPEEFSVARNLREMKAEIAALRRAKQAGRTSIGPNDGAMEIRNASNQPVALVGHSGSAGGLLVRNRENTAWVSLADERNRIDGRVDYVWTSIDSHASRLTSVESRATTLEGHRARIDGRIDVVWNSIDSHASRLSSAESALSSAASSIAALTNHTVQLAAYLSSLRTWLIDNIGGTPPVRPDPPTI